MTGSPWGALMGACPSVPVDALERFALELHRWNRTVRLVGPRDLPGVRGQVEDALLPFVHVPPKGPVLDIGCGAGLPGIPLALWDPDLEVVGLEPRQKRVTFVRHVTRLLCPGRMEVVALRSDQAPVQRPDLKGRFSTVTARAVAEVPALLAQARWFLAEGGRVILPRGGGVFPCPKGWRVVDRVDYTPPPGFGPRCVVVFAVKGGLA